MMMMMMMEQPSVLYVVVLVVALLTTTCTASNSRNSQDNGYYNNYYNDDDDGNFATQAKDRIEQDVADMWITSPSSWGTEYWEVFAATVAIAFAVLGCLLFLCCAPICLFPSAEEKKQKPLYIATQEEFENHQQKKNNGDTLAQPILDGGNKDASKQDAPDGAAKNNPEASKTTKTGDEAVLANSAGSPLRSSKKKRERTSLWSEVVSVWKEFLTGKEEDSELDRHYLRYVDTDEGTKSPLSSSPSSSRKRSSKRSSRKKQQAPPSPRKNEKTSGSDSKDQDNNNENKPKIYQGMIV